MIPFFHIDLLQQLCSHYTMKFYIFYSCRPLFVPCFPFSDVRKQKPLIPLDYSSEFSVPINNPRGYVAYSTFEQRTNWKNSCVLSLDNLLDNRRAGGEIRYKPPRLVGSGSQTDAPVYRKRLKNSHHGYKNRSKRKCRSKLLTIIIMKRWMD